MFEVYYSYGWRLNELPSMPVRQLDFESRTITIDTSKNGDGRTVKMTQKGFELLKACCEGKCENDYVFTRENEGQVKDFRAHGNPQPRQQVCPLLRFTTCVELVPETYVVLA
jgi:site-specific recombinase XerD